MCWEMFLVSRSDTKVMRTTRVTKVIRWKTGSSILRLAKINLNLYFEDVYGVVTV